MSIFSDFVSRNLLLRLQFVQSNPGMQMQMLEQEPWPLNLDLGQGSYIACTLCRISCSPVLWASTNQRR